MSIKITIDDFTIEVDTETELRMVLSNLGIRQRAVSIRPSDYVIDTNVLTELFRNIPSYTKAYDLLNLLKAKPSGVTTEELMEKLHLDNWQALGGVFSGVAKHAHNLGVSTNDIYEWRFLGGKDTYKLTDEMLEAMESASEKSNGEQDS